MIIYLDVVFFENFIMNFLIIYTESVCIGLNDTPWRKIVAAILASLVYIFGLFFPLLLYFQIVLSFIIVIIAYGFSSLKMLIKRVCLFYIISFVFGGVSFALMSWLDRNKLSVFNGIVIGNLSLIKIFFSGMFALIATIWFVKRKKEHIIKDIVVSLNGRKAELKVLMDTGNLLKEPYGNRPVMIVELLSLKGVLDEEVYLFFNEIIEGKKNIPEGMFSIPYMSLGETEGYLLGFEPDYVFSKDSRRKYNDLVIGVCKDNLSNKNLYSGLFGLEVLEE